MAGDLGGHQAGYAKPTFRVTVSCARCGQPTGVRAGTDAAVDAADFLTQAGRGHSTCPGDSA
jgi:hypothetical protein